MSTDISATSLHPQDGLPDNSTRNRQIVTASWIGIILNSILAAGKITIGLLSGSFAVVSDGVDSGVDILTSLITLLAARLMMRPPDSKFPFGYSRVDPLATKVLSFFIFFAGFQLILGAGKNLLHLLDGSAIPPASLPKLPALIVTAISIAVKIFLAQYKISLGKRIESSMLVADGQNMRLDIVTSVVVLLSLIAVQLSGLVIIDALTGILVSIWIMRIAVSIFLETNTELMDGMADTGVYRQIFEAIHPVQQLYNPHRMRVRKMGHLLLIVMDIEVPADMTIAQAHEISLEVEALIRTNVKNVYDIIIHIDPLGLEENDKFGLSPDHEV